MISRRFNPKFRPLREALRMFEEQQRAQRAPSYCVWERLLPAILQAATLSDAANTLAPLDTPVSAARFTPPASRPARRCVRSGMSRLGVRLPLAAGAGGAT